VDTTVVALIDVDGIRYDYDPVTGSLARSI